MQASKWVIGVLVVILLVIVGALVSRNSGSDDKSLSPIKIGFIGPLSGDAASYGESSRDGVILAVDELNALGGVGGRKVEVIYEDGKCSGKDSASAAQKLINVDKVKVMVAGSCSGEVFGYAPITESAKVVTIAPFASNPRIADIGDFVFRNFPSDAFMGSEFASLVKRDFAKVAIVSEDTEYAQGLRDVFKSRFVELGGEINGDEVISPNTTDFRTTVTKLLAGKPEAIFLNAQTGAGDARLAKQLRDQGSKAQFYVAFFLGDDYIGTGPAVEGTMFVDTPKVGEGSEKGSKFILNFEKRFGRTATYPFAAAGAYDDTYILANAVGKYGDDTEAIRDYLYSLTDYDGAIGKYGFDAKGELVGIKASFRKLEKGNLVDITL